MGSRIDKVRNFNQILLAIAGVIGIILLLISSVIFIIEIMPRDYEEEGMIVNEEVETLNEQGLRKEIISFENIQIVDSANQIFILPVTQASLDNPESSDESLGLMNSFSGKGGYYRDLIYNNIVVYYGKMDSSIVVFNERLSIGKYIVSKQKEGNFILVTGCKEDSNKDNLLNSKDLQQLYVFNIDKQKFAKIDTPANHTTLRIFQPKNANHVICMFGVDRDKNGIFSDNLEPTIYMTLDLKKLVLNNMVSESNINKLQTVLERK